MSVAEAGKTNDSINIEDLHGLLGINASPLHIHPDIILHGCVIPLFFSGLQLNQYTRENRK